MTHMYFSPRTDGIRNFRHALRAAYRTAISAAQILVCIWNIFWTGHWTLGRRQTLLLLIDSADLWCFVISCLSCSDLSMSEVCDVSSWITRWTHIQVDISPWCSFAINGPRTWNSLPTDLRTHCRYDPLLLQASSQGPHVSAVVYAAAGRWAQQRSYGAVVTV